MSGFIKIDRKMIQWNWYRDIKVKSVFQHCLLRANYEKTEVMGHVLLPGQFIASLGNFSYENGTTLKETRTAFEKLKKSGEITTKIIKKGLVVTVCNWLSYQSKNDIEGTPKARQGHAKGTPRATVKEDKKLRNKEYPPTPQIEVGEVDKVKVVDSSFFNSYNFQNSGLKSNPAQIANAEFILSKYPRTNMSYNRSSALIAILRAVQDYADTNFEYIVEKYANYAKSLNDEERKYIVHPDRFFNDLLFLQDWKPKAPVNTNPDWLKFQNYYQANFCALTSRNGIDEWKKIIPTLEKKILFEVMGELKDNYIKIKQTGTQAIAPKLSDVMAKYNNMHNSQKQAIEQQKKQKEQQQNADTALNFWLEEFEKLTVQQVNFIITEEEKDEWGLRTTRTIDDLTNNFKKSLAEIWQNKYSAMYAK